MQCRLPDLVRPILQKSALAMRLRKIDGHASERRRTLHAAWADGAGRCSVVASRREEEFVAFRIRKLDAVSASYNDL